VTDGSELREAVQALRETVPSGPSSLHAAFDALRRLDPMPDNVYLLVDGLPTMGETRLERDGVTSRERADHFYRALRLVPSGVPVNVVLLALEGDPWAAPLYWELGLRTGGGFIAAPAADDRGPSAGAIFDVDPDVEHVIFIVDTSGSMQSYAWGRVQEQIRETLAAHPNLKGLQVMNDEGTYLFKSYRGAWMPDTPVTREAIVDAMRNWDDYSDSSPREGILAALDTFYDPNKKISLYVYSDDFLQGSINPVVREIDRRNRTTASGERLVRIHAVAFPAVYLMAGGDLYTAAGYATLMRIICQRNGGTFVALPVIRGGRERA
jgi:hypothetical protein